MQQRHLTPTKLKDPNLAPKPQKASPPVAPIPPPTAPQPTGAVSHGRAVFSPHPSVNPLLLNLKEQLLQVGLWMFYVYLVGLNASDSFIPLS